MNTYSGIVLSNHHETDRYYHLVVACPELACKVQEGQIIHIKCGDTTDPLLRRPFSVYRFHASTGIVEFLYLVKGKGTEIMKGFKKNDKIDLLGPVGNHYEIHENVKTIGILGRGVGIASLASLCESARKKEIEVIAILSGRTLDAVVCKDMLEQIGCQVICVNDEDGSSSMDNIRNLLLERIHHIDQIFTCGSKRMGRLIKELSMQYGIPAYISLEEHMACGIGVCKGCVCKTDNGYKTVCKDGPIFSISEVEL